MKEEECKLTIRVSELGDAKYLEKWMNEDENLEVSFPGIMDEDPELKKYGIQKWIYSFTTNTSLTLLLDNVPVGVASFWMYDNSSMRHHGLFGIVIDKDYRGHGFGTILMNNTLDFATNVLKYKFIELQVTSENTDAIKLYKKFGFKEICSMKDYVFINSRYMDLILMRRYL